MTGMEIPGVGMAPGGKIVKPEEEVFFHIFTINAPIFNFWLQVKEHLCNMLALAEAMSASKHWNYLAQYSILKVMLTDLRIIARGENLEGAGSSTVLVEQFEKQFDQLEEQLEEYVDDASAQEGETGGSKLAPPPAITCHQSGAVKGNQVDKPFFQPQSHHLNPLRQEEQVGVEQVDAQLVEQLHHAYRLISL